MEHSSLFRFGMFMTRGQGFFCGFRSETTLVSRSELIMMNSLLLLSE